MVHEDSSRGIAVVYCQLFAVYRSRQKPFLVSHERLSRSRRKASLLIDKT